MSTSALHSNFSKSKKRPRKAEAAFSDPCRCCERYQLCVLEVEQMPAASLGLTAGRVDPPADERMTRKTGYEASSGLPRNVDAQLQALQSEQVTFSSFFMNQPPGFQNPSPDKKLSRPWSTRMFEFRRGECSRGALRTIPSGKLSFASFSSSLSRENKRRKVKGQFRRG